MTDVIERLTKLSKVGFGYDIKPEDRRALEAAVAALSASPAGVVKPLEWGPVIDGGWDRVANTPFGEYVISVDSDAAGGVHYLWLAGQPEGDEHHSVHKTMTAAKSAAFADYSARIMSSIEPAAPQCCMCGKKGLSTVEGDGGTECELTDGRWVCSAECWDRAVEPAGVGVETENRLLEKLKVMRGVFAMQKEEYTSRALHNIITEFEASRAAITKEATHD